MPDPQGGVRLTPVRTILLKGMRSTIARKLRQSVATQPLVTLHVTCDASALISLHQGRRARWEQEAGCSVTLTAVVAFLVVQALRRDGRLNGWVQQDAVELYGEVHLGVAVALEDGLIVPVVHDAHTLSLPGLARRVTDLAARAKEGRLLPEEVLGSTFTITNLGAYGIDFFTPILNPPQIGILGVGRTRPSGPGTARGLSLTFDHGAVDGARAAQWLQNLIGLVERPEESFRDT
ncbi:MAG: 2-oxo acid dehydrogenase subunit E2 [Limnochordaceae bacterium]|nr:2-oxo acid dehydrogenase subunit E2 [Limnochordaceae bacterium]